MSSFKNNFASCFTLLFKVRMPVTEAMTDKKNKLIFHFVIFIVQLNRVVFFRELFNNAGLRRIEALVYV